MINYNHLYYFHVVATEGSFANAAERLGLTQPTISEQVRTLERSIGAVLFERQPAGLRLTDAGRMTFEQTSIMFHAGQRLHLALTAPTTSLRVGVSGNVARSSTSDLLMPLLDVPGCVPSTRTADARELLRDVRDGDLDLALVDGDPPQALRRGIEATLVAPATLVAVARPDVTLADDWSNVGLVTYGSDAPYSWDIETFLETKQLAPTLAAEADDALVLLEAALRGGYIAFVPRAIAREAVEQRRLVELVRLDSTHASIYAVRRDDDVSELPRRAIERLVATYAQA